MSRLKINQKGFLKLTKHTLVSYLIVATIFFGGGLFYLINPFIKKTEAVWLASRELWRSGPALLKLQHEAYSNRIQSRMLKLRGFDDNYGYKL